MYKQNGFTLIELLIVVAIIGILAAIAVPNFLNAQTRAKIARVQADLKNVGTALEQYKLDQNAYPPGVGDPPPKYYRVTTPVSYMGSCPRDIFAENWEHMWHTKGWYHYVCRDTNEAWFHSDWSSAQGHMMNSADLNAPYKPPAGLKWHLRSVGPDKILNHGFPFDASNGLHSTGDINVWGP
jgi:type II secretion system protein G